MSIVATLLRRWRVARLAAELNLTRAADFDAHQAPAQPTEDRLANVERTVIDRYEDRVHDLLRQRELELKTERMNSIDAALAEDEKSFADIVRDTKTELSKEILDARARLIAANDEVRRADDELERFKRDNLLRRDCEQRSPYLAAGIIASMVVVETAANGLLFAEVSQWGLVGGACNALALAVPAIFVSLFGGFFGLRQRLHVSPEIRRRGTLISLATGAFVLFWSFYVAHLRVRAEQLKDNPEALSIGDWSGVFTQMLAAPLAPLNHPAATGLLAITLIVAALTAWEGFAGLADRYPGFPTVDRRHRAVVAERDARFATLGSVLAQTTEVGIAAIKHRHRRADGKLREGIVIVGNVQTVAARFARLIGHEHWVYREVLQRYRAVNARHRAPETVPERFQSLPLKAPSAFDPTFDTAAARKRLQEMSKAFFAFRETAIGDLQQNLLTELSALQPGAPILSGPTTPSPALPGSGDSDVQSP